MSETYGDEQVISDLNRRSELVEGMDPSERKPLELQLQYPMTFGAFETALYDLIGRVHGVEIDEDGLDRLHEKYHKSDPLAYSSVESMAAEYADAMSDIGRTDWLPNKPRW